MYISIKLSVLIISIFSESGQCFQLGECVYDDPRTGVMTLAPHGNSHLALVLMGNSLQGLKDAVSLATPTIPPMTRSPVSCLLMIYYFVSGILSNVWNIYQMKTLQTRYCTRIHLKLIIIHNTVNDLCQNIN